MFNIVHSKTLFYNIKWIIKNPEQTKQNRNKQNKVVKAYFSQKTRNRRVIQTDAICDQVYKIQILILNFVITDPPYTDLQITEWILDNAFCSAWVPQSSYYTSAVVFNIV